MGKGNRRDPAKAADWRKQIAIQRRSGISVNRFCREHNLSTARFHWWKRELLRRQAAEPGGALFAEVQVTPTHGPERGADDEQRAPEAVAIEVVLSGGQRLCVRPGFDAETFSRLLALLEPPPC